MVPVHKSQGSEYDYAALILPERELPLVTRELLYTAMTRSRRAVVILPRRFHARRCRRPDPGGR